MKVGRLVVGGVGSRVTRLVGLFFIIVGGGLGCSDAKSGGVERAWDLGNGEEADVGETVSADVEVGADGAGEVPVARSVCGERTVKLAGVPDPKRVEAARDCEVAKAAPFERVKQSPRPYRNLEKLALTLTDEIVVPPELYGRVVLDVLAIREAYPAVEDTDFDWPDSSKLNDPFRVRKSDELHERIMEGNPPHEWTCLNAYYAVWKPKDWIIGRRSSGVYHMAKLAREYERIPGVERATVHDRPSHGDEEPSLPRSICAGIRAGGVYHYVIWGQVDLFHFRSTSAGCIELLDRYDDEEDERKPEWFGICQYLD